MTCMDLMNRNIQLQGDGDVFSNGDLDRMSTWEAIGTGQMVLTKFRILRIALFDQTELPTLVEFLLVIMFKYRY